MVLLVVSLFLLLLAIPPPVWAQACTHYAGPPASPPAGSVQGSSNNNGLSVGSPFLVTSFWSVATPGSTLCLHDGTYTGANSLITPPVNLAGTSGNPITIRALNDGGALLDGQGTAVPVVLGTTHSWLVVEGINARNGANQMFLMHGANNIFRRVIGWNLTATGSTSTTSLFFLQGTNNLIEDCAGWGLNVRFIMQGSATASSPGSTFRRCWAEFNDHPGATLTTLPGRGYTLGVGQRLENVIGTVNNTGD